jgi:hypothetical protein
MVELRTHGLQLTVRAVGKADSENWARVQLDVLCNGFQGQFTASLQVEDLSRFLTQLSGMSDRVGEAAVAWLSGAEPDIDIRVEMNKRGQIAGTYRFESERRDGIPTVLSGSFEMDQTYIPPFITQLQNLKSQLCD